MSKPSAIPANFGFYLILLTAFCVSVFPDVSYFLAIGAILVWLFQSFVFRETGFVSSILFYPIAGLAVFSFLVWILSAIYSVNNPMACVGISSLFYFVVFSFVSSREKRKMIIWTFFAGVILSVIIAYLAAMSAMPDAFPQDVILEERLPALVIIGLCLAIAYYVEAPGIRERVFFGLVSIPLIIGILNVDYTIALTALLVLTAAGLVRYRPILIAVLFITVLAISGFFGIKGDLGERYADGSLARELSAPWNRIDEYSLRLSETGFYGVQADETSMLTDPFFVSLARHGGPPMLLFFLWVIIELGRRDLTRLRKLPQKEEKAFHLAALLVIVILVIVNIYGSSLGCTPAMIGLWMFFGMAEI